MKEKEGKVGEGWSSLEQKEILRSTSLTKAQGLRTIKWEKKRVGKTLNLI